MSGNDTETNNQSNVDFETAASEVEKLCALVDEALLCLSESSLVEVALGLGVRAGRLKTKSGECKSRLQLLSEISNFLEKKCSESVEDAVTLLTSLNSDLKERVLKERESVLSEVVDEEDESDKASEAEEKDDGGKGGELNESTGDKVVPEENTVEESNVTNEKDLKNSEKKSEDSTSESEDSSDDSEKEAKVVPAKDVSQPQDEEKKLEQELKTIQEKLQKVKMGSTVEKIRSDEKKDTHLKELAKNEAKVEKKSRKGKRMKE